MPPALRPGSWLRASALASLWLLASAAGHAQHPVAPRTRPLPQRLAEADAVALATVREVELGRIVVDDARALAGEVPHRFEIKRSPGQAPPLESGDRALLLLRGARPPYVLVDRPEETIRLAGRDVEERWATAVQSLLRVLDRPAQWVPLYVSWIEQGPETLRDLAVDGLLDPTAPFQPVAPAVLAQLGREAWDETRDLGTRRAAARLASFDPGGSARLAEGFLAAPPDADPTLAETTLRAVRRQDVVDPRLVLLRGLGHPDAGVRRTALRSARQLGGDPGAELRARVEAVARDDPESWLRAEAQTTLSSFPKGGADVSGG
jgi:hypothetical protein